MRLGFGPQDWDLGLQAGIWASRLSHGPGGGGGREKEEKKEEEKIPLCESIGHRFLWGRCPKRRNERTREMGNEGKEYDVTWKSFIIAILTLLSLPCWKTN